jgi:hypothetical protein
VQAEEGNEIAGGETDVIMPEKLIVENKVAGEVQDLSNLKPDADWQMRRYSMAYSRRIGFVIVAYKPGNEGALLAPPDRVSVHQLPGTPEMCAVVRLLIPWGHGTPSTAKAL